MTHINPLTIITQKLEEKVDIDKLIWYILYCYSFSDNEHTNTENHHILPRKLFPEYTNLNIHVWNSSKLSKKNHIIAHYILVGAIRSRSTLAAFNMMKRAIKQTDDIDALSTIYAEYRESFSDMFRKINLGRVHTNETKKKLSLITTGRVPVYSPLKPSHIFTVSVDDPRYLNGELLHNATGRTHSEETKKIMSENGIKNKVAVHEKENPSNIIYIHHNDTIPEGYCKGNINQKENASNRFKDAQHYHDPITGIEYRIKTLTIPPGLVKGRNPKTLNPLIGTYSHKNYKTNIVSLEEFKEYPIYCGSPRASNAFIFEGKITFTVDVLLKHFPTKLNKSIISKLRYQEGGEIYPGKVDSKIRDYIKDFTKYEDIPLLILPIKDSIDMITEVNWLQ